eukprot:3936359-Rhodomonas_salina.1
MSSNRINFANASCCGTEVNNPAFESLRLELSESAVQTVPAIFLIKCLRLEYLAGLKGLESYFTTLRFQERHNKFPREQKQKTVLAKERKNEPSCVTIHPGVQNSNHSTDTLPTSKSWQQPRRRSV